MTYAKQDTTSTSSSSSKQKSKKISKAQRIRALRNDGFKPTQIAAMIGCDVQAVYNQNYTDKKSQAKKAAKLKAAIAQHVENLREEHRVAIEQHVENLKDAQTMLAAKPKLSFMQRVRVLFTGVV